MKKRGTIVVQTKEKIVEINCGVQKNNISSPSLEYESFTGENEVSSPSPSRKVLRGNIYTTSFTPSLWKDIMNNFALQTSLAYNIKKLKSKHSRMKDLWRKFYELMVQEIGLGWGDVMNMLIGPVELWQGIIQRNPKHAELWHKGCLQYHKLTTIFSNQTATGYATRASTQMPFTETAGSSSSAVARVGNEHDEGEPRPSLM